MAGGVPPLDRQRGTNVLRLGLSDVGAGGEHLRERTGQRHQPALSRVRHHARAWRSAKTSPRSRRIRPTSLSTPPPIRSSPVTGSTLILNSQIYGRPLHKGNFTIDAFNPPSNLEFIANAQYVGVNNSQHLAPYVNVSFGVTHPLGIGMLTLFETNAFNTETALFSTINGAQPQPLAGGGFLLVAANPLPPRTIQLSYSINTGARKGAVAQYARGGGSLRAAAQVAQATASPAPGGVRGGVGFGELHFVAPPPGTSPLAVATSRTECTAELQPLATTAFAQLGAAAAAYAAGTSPLPAVTGVERDAARRSEGRLVLCARTEHPARSLPAPAGRRASRRRTRAGWTRRSRRPLRRTRRGRTGWSSAGVPIADHRGPQRQRQRHAAAGVHAESGLDRRAAAVPGAGVVLVRHRSDAR